MEGRAKRGEGWERTIENDNSNLVGFSHTFFRLLAVQTASWRLSACQRTNKQA